MRRILASCWLLLRRRGLRLDSGLALVLEKDSSFLADGDGGFPQVEWLNCSRIFNDAVAQPRHRHLCEPRCAPSGEWRGEARAFAKRLTEQRPRLRAPLAAEECPSRDARGKFLWRHDQVPIHRRPRRRI